MANTYDFLGDYKGYFQKSSSQVYCDASGSLQYIGKTAHEVEVDMGTEYVEWFDNTSGTQSLYILIVDKVDPKVNFSWMQVADPNTLPMVYNLDSDTSGAVYDYHFAGSDPNSLAEHTWCFASQTIYSLSIELWVREGICMANGSWTHGTPADLSSVPCTVRATIDSTIADEKETLCILKYKRGHLVNGGTGGGVKPPSLLIMNVKDLLNYTNNIDKLLSDKVQDYVLLEEMPMAVSVGKKTIYIGNFTLENNYKFFNDYGKLMSHLGLKFINFDHMAEGNELYALCMKNKKWYKGMLKIISNTILKQQAFYLDRVGDERKEIKWKNCSIGYFKKNVTVSGLMQIVKLIYLYNFDAEKKNFQILLKNNPMSLDTETYMYNWLKNLPGLTGKFGAVLYPKPASLDKEYLKVKEDSLTKKVMKKDDK